MTPVEFTTNDKLMKEYRQSRNAGLLKKLLEVLTELNPVNNTSIPHDMNQAALRGTYTAGYTQCMQFLRNLDRMNFQPVAEQEQALNRKEPSEEEMAQAPTLTPVN